MRLRSLAGATVTATLLSLSPAGATGQPAPEVYAAWSQITGSANAPGAAGFTDLNISVRIILETGDARDDCPDFSGKILQGGTETPVPLNFVKRTNSPDGDVDGETSFLTVQRFPIVVCEANAPDGPGRLTLMDGTTEVTFSNSSGTVVTLPLAASVGASGPPTFVAFGDTGCRGIGNGRGSQDCTDGSTSARYTHFRFDEVAKHAASRDPDFVVHLGDYRYDKETLGKNFEYWDSDFFEQVRLGLLHEVPWVFVRGNHEVCDRAGHGWFYFFGPGMGTCVGGSRAGDAWHFDVADRSNNLANPHRFIVIDTSSYLSPGHTTAVDGLSRVIQSAQTPSWPNNAAPSSWLLMHKPLWGIENHNGIKQQDSNTGDFVTYAMETAGISDCTNYDAGKCTIKAVLAAHLHVLQNVVTEKAALPQQYIVGHSGVRMDHTVHRADCTWSLKPRGFSASGNELTGIIKNARGRAYGSRGNDDFGYVHFVRNPSDGLSGWEGRAYFLDGNTTGEKIVAATKTVTADGDPVCRS